MKLLFISLVVLLGITNITQSLYIYHGDRVQEGEIPFQVSVQTHIGNMPGYCGGSLIRPNFVLTAAHCVGENTTVSYGGVVLAELPEKQAVDLTIVHENPKENDIALLRLPIPVTHIPPVPLAADQDYDTDGILFTAAGYGDTFNNGNMSEYLLKAYLLGMSNEKCAKIYGGEIEPDLVFLNNFLCVSPSDEYNQSACSGDSGGPLISRNAQGQAVLFGVAKGFHSKLLCEKGAPQVFIRVSVYKPWIDEKISQANSP